MAFLFVPATPDPLSKKVQSILVSSFAHPVRRAAARHARRLLRYGVVGATGVVINMAALYFLVEAAHAHHLIAAAIASEISILSNFLLNDRWTFGDVRVRISWPRRLLQYNGITLGGTLLSLGVLALLIDVIGIYYLVANLFAIGVATIANYMLNSRFTWAAGETRHDPEDPLAA